MFHLLKKEGFLACIIVMPSVYPPGNERIYVVDALRGFAVMAIMLLHFLEHFIYNSYPVASSPMMEAANQQFKEVFFFLFAGKSYTIFALLFGFTFAVQYRNQARKGRDFAGRFVWRMCLLAVFACMNAAFFPGGDVLLTFSLAGLLLVPCRRLKTSSLVALSLFFLAQPLEWAYAAVQWMHPGWVPPSLSVAESYASLKSAVDTGNFWVMAWENLTTGQWASLAWGIEAGRLMQESYSARIVGTTVAGHALTAIQLTTAAGICCALDLVAGGVLPQQGFIGQESIAFVDFIANRFGQYYRAQDLNAALAA